MKQDRYTYHSGASTGAVPPLAHLGDDASVYRDRRRRPVLTSTSGQHTGDEWAVLTWRPQLRTRGLSPSESPYPCAFVPATCAVDNHWDFGASVFLFFLHCRECG